MIAWYMGTGIGRIFSQKLPILNNKRYYDKYFLYIVAFMETGQIITTTCEYLLLLINISYHICNYLISIILKKCHGEMRNN